MVEKREGREGISMSQLDAQASFLNHIAAKLGRPRRSGVKPPVWSSKPYEHLYQGLDQEALIEQFISNLDALSTEVDRVFRADLGKALEKVIHKFGIKSVIYWDDQRLHDLQLGKLCDEIGLQHMAFQREKGKKELLEYAAHQADMGITFADMGLAETGSVILFNGGGRGRVVSLLPPVYLAILTESSIKPRLTQAASHIHQQVSNGLPSYINFITGPSRTADIEMDLALGVHGPGKVHVILLRD